MATYCALWVDEVVARAGVRSDRREWLVPLQDECGSPDEHLWLVPKAKHSQGPQVEPEAYFEKLTAFFDAHPDRLPDPSEQFGLDPREVLPTSLAEWEPREVPPAQPMFGAK